MRREDKGFTIEFVKGMLATLGLCIVGLVLGLCIAGLVFGAGLAAYAALTALL